MTRLLVSVRSAAEAELALTGGAQLIDVKEPARGALGAASWEEVQGVVVAVAGRVPVSAALGELCDDRGVAVPSGVAYAKLGLAGAAGDSAWPQRWEKALGRLPDHVRRVAVAYADWRAAAAPPPADVIRHGSGVGCTALLVDTFIKGRGDLFTHLTRHELEELLAAARDRCWLTVLGGSLSAEAVPSAAELGPDYLAVRGAACRGGRSGVLDPERVHHLAAALRAARSSRPVLPARPA
jgi:uncharacterized protein (UPF0264 family)